MPQSYLKQFVFSFFYGFNYKRLIGTENRFTHVISTGDSSERSLQTSRSNKVDSFAFIISISTTDGYFLRDMVICEKKLPEHKKMYHLTCASNDDSN